MDLEKTKPGLIILIIALSLITIFSLAFTGVVAQAPSFNPYSFTNSPGTSATNSFMNLENASHDFLVQVIDYQPKVVRSDLLEEQDVPVYAQLALTKNNPLISTPRIKFFNVVPAREVDGIKYPHNLVSSVMNAKPPEGITLKNAGYVVVTLTRREKNESKLPDNITIPLKAIIQYDPEYILGVRVEDKVLKPFPKEKEQEWRAELPIHSFWNKAGYIRITNIEGEQVRGQIYDSRINPISQFILDKSRKEAFFWLPQFTTTTYTGKGQGIIKLIGTTDPEARARLLINVDGQSYKVLLKKGDSFYEGSNWQVKEIFVEDKTTGTGKVILMNKATGQEAILELVSKQVKEQPAPPAPTAAPREEVTEFLSPEEFGLASVGVSKITSFYCSSRSDVRGYHYGYDFPASGGTPVKAVYGGEVVWTGNWKIGQAVWIKSYLSDGTPFAVSYGHINAKVKMGDQIKKGDIIGTIYDYNGDHLDAKMFWYPYQQGYVNYWLTAFKFDKGTIGKRDKCPEPVKQYTIPSLVSTQASPEDLYKKANQQAELALSFLPLINAQEDIKKQVKLTTTFNLRKDPFVSEETYTGIKVEPGTYELLQIIYDNGKPWGRIKYKEAEGWVYLGGTSSEIINQEQTGQGTTQTQQTQEENFANSINVKQAYTTAMNNYWQIVSEFSDLNVPEEHEQAGKTWGQAALEKIIELADSFRNPIKEEEKETKRVKAEYADLITQARNDLERAYNYVETNYPDLYEAKYKEKRDASLKYDFSKAEKRIEDILTFESGIREEQSILVTLLKIDVPDPSDKYAEVALKKGEAVIDLYEGDYFLKTETKEILVSEITGNSITIGGITATKEDKKEIVDGLSFSYSDFKERTGITEKNLGLINLYAHDFKERFHDGDIFLGRRVEIKDDVVLLKDLGDENNRKSQITITKDRLAGIDASLYIFAKKFAHIQIVPTSQNRRTEANFLLHIGIEKRLIKLSPEAMQRQANQSRKIAQKIEKISNSLDKVISTWRRVCMATSAWLILKNFWQNMQGKGWARDKVMVAYKDICADQVGYDKEYNNFHECFLHYQDEIEASTSAILAARDRTNQLLKPGTEQGIIYTETIGNTKVERVNVEKLKETLKEYETDPEKQKKIEKALDNIAAYEDVSGQKTILPSQAKDLILNFEIKKQAGAGSVLANTYGKYADSNLEDWLKVGQAKGQELEQFNTLVVNAGGIDKIKQNRNNIKEDVTKKELFDAFSLQYGNKGAIGPYWINGEKKVGVFNPDQGKYVWASIETKDGETYAKLGKKTEDGQEKENLIPVYFRTKCTFEGLENSIQFYSGTNKGKVYATPFPTENGQGFVQVLKYDVSGQPTQVVISSPIAEGCDGPWLWKKGMSVQASRELALRNAFEMIKRVNALPEEKKVPGVINKLRIFGLPAEYGITREKIVSPQAECEDFMSPQDCEILFEVCDPVMCPPSRFNLNGRWPVRDVVQTGVLGSIILGQGNGDTVPICLPGVSAGLMNYASILNSYADCLDNARETGATTGICDRIRSIYICETLWREGMAIVNAHGGLINLLGKALGKNKGGIEYLNFKESLKQVSKSVQWFTSQYAAPVFAAFKARSGQEIGTYICKAAFYGRLPGVGNLLSEIAKPEKPVQFFAFMEEIPYSSLSEGPFGRQYAQSQYKVYFHIYAGEDKGVFYRVYLKDKAFVPGEPRIHFWDVPSRPGAEPRGFLPASKYADATIDFLAPSGFKQVCVEIDSVEYCGFGKVSTDFIVKYASDLYLREQLEKPVKNAKECMSGTASAVPLEELPLAGTGALTEAVHGGIQKRGVIRVCDAQNPGKGVNPDRWKVVGTCGIYAGQELKCWLDTYSVGEAITDLKFINQTIQQAEQTDIKYWVDQEKYFTTEQSQEKVKEAENLFLQGKYEGAIKLANSITKKTLDVQSRARALFVIARSNAMLAENKKPEMLEPIPPPVSSGKQEAGTTPKLTQPPKTTQPQGREADLLEKIKEEYGIISGQPNTYLGKANNYVNGKTMEEKVKVAKLQQDLDKIDYYDLKEKGPSGVFDNEVEQAVKAFQRANGLSDDGIVGPKTATSLILAVEFEKKQPGITKEELTETPEMSKTPETPGYFTKEINSIFLGQNTKFSVGQYEFELIEMEQEIENRNPTDKYTAVFKVKFEGEQLKCYWTWQERLPELRVKSNGEIDFGLGGIIDKECKDISFSNFNTKPAGIDTATVTVKNRQPEFIGEDKFKFFPRTSVDIRNPLTNSTWRIKLKVIPQTSKSFTGFSLANPLFFEIKYKLPGANEFVIVCKSYGMIKEKLSYKLEAYDYNTGKTFKASQEPECGVVKFGDVKINEDEGSVEAKVYFNEFLNGERKRFNKKSLNQKLMMIQPLPTKKGEKPKFSKEYFVVSFKGFDNKKYAKTKVKTAMFILTKRIFGTKYKSSDNLDCWDGGGTEKNVIVFPESARAWGTVWSAQGINLAKVFDKFDEECKRVLFEDINVGENLKWVEVTIKIIESTEKGVTRTREE